MATMAELLQDVLGYAGGRCQHLAVGSGHGSGKDAGKDQACQNGCQHAVLSDQAGHPHDQGLAGRTAQELQGVLDHRVGEAGGDIRNRSAFFLRLFYVGVHEYGTSRSEIHRVLGKKCRLREILNAVV